MTAKTMDQYISDRMMEAMRIHGMLSGAMTLIHEDGRKEQVDAAYNILEVALTVAQAHLDALDSVDIPKVAFA